MIREAVFKKGTEVTFVGLNQSGQVVVKQGNETRIHSKAVKYEDVVVGFREAGWVEAEFTTPSSDVQAEVRASIDRLSKRVISEQLATPTAYSTEDSSYLAKAAQNSLDQDVNLDVIQKVDEYLELHKQQTELKKKMEELKSPIKDYMVEKRLKSIKGTHGAAVALQEATASNSTSIYSNYEIGDVAPLLPKDLLNRVTESRVNSDTLEGILKSDKSLDKELIDQVKAAKIVKPGTARFTVKK
ncbi:hypothetical protein Goe27_01520 [Bacillus phage vB_BsuM-Goe27]|nr:hypothetical protein Goe27_01520 [Bacillus phage vB_BsuM-Goe27]